MEIEWEKGFRILVTAENGEVVISANRAGLLSLAKQFTALAEEKTGGHIHYDRWNSLEENSVEMIVELVDDAADGEGG